MLQLEPGLLASASDGTPLLSLGAMLDAMPARDLSAQYGRFTLPLSDKSECLVERLAGGAIDCVFLRLDGHAFPAARLVLSGHFRILPASAGGWLAQLTHPGGDVYWLPRAPILRRTSEGGHVLAEQDAGIGGLACSVDECSLDVVGQAGWHLDIAALRVRGDLAQHAVSEFGDSDPEPTRRVFLWGSHTALARPADVFHHLIHGAIFENRYAWPFKRKIWSENDAHAIFVALSGLEHATGKRLYGLLRDQVLVSVLARQSEDGGFRHGEWTDGMESHYRLHCSAMHLMMDALAERDDPEVSGALGRAASFIAGRHGRIDTGVWFLHDDLEQSTEALSKGPFRWVWSRALGKSESNMLVLNTHLDTLVALDRYLETTGDDQFAGLVESGRAAARAVVGLHSADWLYRAIFAVVGLTFLPSERARLLPAWKRALKRIGWKYLIPRLPDIKARWPRLVMPGGYIDREFTLRTWAHDYHAINLMDLARYHRRFPEDGIWPVVYAGLRFCRESGLAKRWKEMEYQRYAIGFWAEALYHACLLDPSPDYRAWLADAMLDLEELGLGQPPSLLGANAEAVPVGAQVPCPAPSDPRLRVANLCCAERIEHIVVNPSPDVVALAWSRNEPGELHWTDAAGQPVAGTPPAIPPRAWARGLAPKVA